MTWAKVPCGSAAVAEGRQAQFGKRVQEAGRQPAQAAIASAASARGSNTSPRLWAGGLALQSRREAQAARAWDSARPIKNSIDR